MAIIGMAGRFPNAQSPRELWARLLAGVELIERFSSDAPTVAADGSYFVPAQGVLHDDDLFDARFFKFTPSEAALTDPQHRIFLETCWHALEDAGCVPSAAGSAQIGICGGMSLSTYGMMALSQGRGIEAGVGIDKDFLATRVAYKLGLTGPALTVQTACSTGLVAVATAVQALLTYQADIMLAGAVSSRLQTRAGYVYTPGGIGSPDGHCRPFDADADGTVGGSGVGVVVLKRLADALADRDHVYAVIRGIAVNNDGADKVGYTAPSVTGQARVIARALALAEVSAASIGYVETHGTGTRLGDPIEVQALRDVYEADGAATQSCLLGSIKANLGHLDAAAGIAGLIKLVLALRTGVVPGTLHFKQPNPRLGLERSPFRVSAATVPLEGISGNPRRAAVSSFGIGGTNVHAVLEEAPITGPADSAPGWHIFPVSGRSESAALANATRVAEALRGEAGAAIADAAYTLQVGRVAMEFRTYAIAADAESAARALASPPRPRLAGRPRVAFLFPGQGAQYAGMGAELYVTDAVFRAVVDECADALRPDLGLDLRSLLLPPDAEHASVADEQLRQTWLTQPALFVVEYALARAWQARGVAPASMLGHSLGEYVAACLAGTFSLTDALKLVALRGRLMERLAEGAMLAVPMDEEALRPLLPAGVTVSAVNAPGRVVVGGEPDAVEQLSTLLARTGTEVRRLNTRRAFHTHMVDGVLEDFRAAVAATARAAPRTPFVSNVTGTWITDAEATDPAYWARHLRSPVLFARGLACIAESDGGVLLEVGPGHALGAFARRVLGAGGAHRCVSSLPGARGNAGADASVADASGRLWVAGVEMNWHASSDGARRRIPLPGYAFERERYTLVGDAPPPSTVEATIPSRTGTDRQVPATAPRGGDGAAAVSEESTGAATIVGTVTRTVAQVLGVDRVQPDDDFYGLGGDSLVAIRVVARLREALGREVPVAWLLEARTPAKLALRLGGLPPIRTDDALPRADRSAPIPVSYAQRPLWLLDQLAPGQTGFNIGLVLAASGPLRLEVLRSSINAIIARHESLRTVFEAHGNEPVQRILPALALDVPLEDFTETPEATRRDAALRRVSELLWRPYDLAAGPLVRVAVARLGEGLHLVGLGMHHIISDAWSLRIFARELEALYGAIASGAPDLLPPLEYHYADYTAWQAARLRGERLEQLLAFWRASLPTPLPVLELPTDRVRPRFQSDAGGAVYLRVPASEVDLLAKLTASKNATQYMALATALFVLLARYSGQKQIIIGTPLANRVRPEFESVIGYFVNAVALPATLSDDPRLGELLERVRDTTHGAFSFQDLPFDVLIRELGVAGDFSRSRGFQVMLNLLNLPRQSFGAGDIKLEAVRSPIRRVLHDISIYVRDGDGVLEFEFEYQTDLFDEATVARMARHYGEVLRALVREPSLRASEVPLLSEQERATLLEGWNQPASPVAVGVHELFAEQARACPSAVAITAGREILTYAEVEARANRLARLLIAQGAGTDVRVGVCLRRSFDAIVALLAVLKAGAGYVPLDPEYPVDRLAFMLADSGARIVLTDRELRARLGGPAGTSLCVDELRASIEAGPADPPGVVTHPRSLAYVIYTSGSTGTPKGVGVEHAALSGYVLSAVETLRLTPSDRVLQFAPLSFDTSAEEIFPTLASGATLVLRDDSMSGSLAAFDAGCRETGVTVIDLPTAFWHELVADLEAGTHRIAPSVRAVIIGGERALPERVLAWNRSVSPTVTLLNTYGPTETTIVATQSELGRDAGARSIAAGRVPIGRPVRGARAYVLDEFLRPVPAGVVGELCIGGAAVARGYLGRPDATAERFLPDPFAGECGARMYRTGDRVRVNSSGEIEFVGRNDGQVKVRGFRIELPEIEAAARGAVGVRDAVAVVRAVSETHRQIVLYLTCDAGASSAGIRSHLRSHLPPYMIPSHVVVLPQLPLSPNGKVDRRALTQMDPEPLEARDPVAAPRNEVEAALLRIWRETLRTERVGIHDDFFELGGDSILGVQLVTRAHREGLRFGPRQLFENPTIAGLAPHVSAAKVSVAPQTPLEGPAAMTPVQRWFFDLGLDEPSHFNMSLLLELRVRLDPMLLERWLRQIVRHHDALRLRFRREPSGWSQYYASVEAAERIPCLEVVDLADASEAEAEARGRIESRAAATQAALDITSGPVIRAVLFDAGANRPQRLLLAVHHLVIDGISWRILLEDLASAYAQGRRGESVDLAPKTSSYDEWARRLESYARSDEGRGELEYWRSQPWGALRPLPVDEDGGVDCEGTAAALEVMLDERETDLLLRAAPKAYRTQVNDLLLLALGTALRRWTGRDTNVVALEGHGREDIVDGVDVTRTVGWFTSVFPVFVRGATGGQLPAVIKAFKESLRRLPHRGVGFGVLRYFGDAEVSRSLRELPWPEIMFNYLGQVDQQLGDGTIFAPARERQGSLFGPRNRRPYVLNVIGVVANGQLRFEWRYGTRRHREATVRSVAEAFLGSLRELIEHCTTDGVGGYTPSDFGLGSLSQETLDAWSASGAEIEDAFVMTPVQQAMLLHSVESPRVGVYVVQQRIRFAGDLDENAFVQAWRLLAERHGMLRATARWRDVEPPHLLIHRRMALPVHVMDWRETPAAECEARIGAYIEAARREGFDLEEGPLARVTVVRLDAQKHEVIFGYHHMLLDGWSLPLLLRDLTTCYESLRRGTQPAFDPVRPYREYVRWLSGRDLGAARGFWSKSLGDVSEPTLLENAVPTVREAPDSASVFETVHTRLSAGELAKLDSFARAHRLTQSTVVNAAWALLLARYTARSEVVFGTVFAGRPAALAGVESMVGLFINTLPARVTVDEGQTVPTWLADFQLVIAGIQDFDWTPLVEALAASGVGRGASIFDSIVVFGNYPVEPAKSARGSIRVEASNSVEFTNYPFALVADPGEELRLRLECRGGTRERGALARLAEHYRNVLVGLLEAGTTRREPRLWEISLVGDHERHELVRQWSDTATPRDRGETLPTLFLQQARRTPDAPAVTFRGQSLTYAELARRAGALAHRLRELGATAESPVGVCVPRSLDLVVAVYAVIMAGAAYIPLDPAFPPGRLEYMVRDSRARWVLTSTDSIEVARATGAEVVAVHDAELDGRDFESAPVAIEADALAYVIYTSGSTGRPKGVGVTHAALANFLHSMARRPGLGASDVVVSVTTLSFDIAGLEIHLPLTVGARVVIASREETSSGAALAALMEREGCTVLQATPATWRMLLDEGWNGRKGLRMLCGGEALPAELAAKLASTGGELWNMYGPTETTIWSTLDRVAAADAITIGKPIANTTVYVLDRRLEPVPVGVPGELYIGGDGLARGYWARPDLTAERFVPDPHHATPGSRMYRTGDLARWRADGRLEHLGRLDQQVKVRGFRIELGEVEVEISRQAGVRSATVVAQGLGVDSRLVAFVVPLEGETLDAARVRDSLRNSLPEYMVPSVVRFVSELPLTPNGKVDRRALSQMPLGVEVGPHEAPHSATEVALAELWQQQLAATSVGLDDDFFALGGHSLLAMRMLASVQRVLGVSVPLQTLFERPRLRDFAHVVDELRAGGRRPALPVSTIAPDRAQRFEPFPLTDIQQAYWVGRRSDIDLGGIGTQVYFEIDWSGADLDRLTDAVRAAISRHDMLRAVVRDDGLQQVLAQVPDFTIPRTSLCGIPDAERAGALQQLRERWASEVLPTDRWPLFAVRAVEISESVTRICVSVDMLLGDAYSLLLVWREVAAAYLLPEREQPAPEVTFRDYVLAELSLHESEAYARALAYWRARVADLPAGPDIPVVHPGGAGASGRFSRREYTLDPEQWSSFKRQAVAHGVTASTAVLAAYCSVLARWSRSPKFTVNLTLFNRLPLHPDIDRVVGDFTAVTLLEVDGSDATPFAAGARAVQKRLWADLDHRLVTGVRVLREIRALDGANPRLMPVVFTSTLGMNAGDSAPAGEAGDVRLVHWRTRTPQVWLDCQVSDGKHGMHVAWDFLDEVFAPGVVDAMFRAYVAELESLSRDPECWNGRASLLLSLGDDVVARDVANRTAAPIPAGLLHDGFAIQAARDASRVAVVSSARTLSYGELDSRATELAHELRLAGVQPGDLVAIVMEKGWEQVVAVLAVLRAGGAYVPIDAAAPSERVLRLLEICGASAVITQPAFEHAFAWRDSTSLHVVRADRAPRTLAPLAPSRAPTDLAYVIFTSGSTGEPKGVMIDHRGALNTVVDVNDRLRLAPDDRVLGLSSLWFDLSVYDIFGPLLIGAALVLPDATASRDPAHWVAWVARERVTVWNSVPALVELLVDYASSGAATGLSSLRAVMMSGDWIPVGLPDRVRKLVPGARLVSMGGATEASIWSIWYEIEGVDPTWRSIPYGKPMRNQTFHVLDRALEPCPVWVPGDLYIGGIGLALGYWADAVKSGASFFYHPQTGERLYRTGDLGRYLPDGNIEFLGREDAQVKIQGFRVELGEIEAALSTHPSVRDCVVDARKDGTVRRLVGYVVLAPDALLSADELRRHLRAKLPEYMVPGVFVAIEAVPLSGNGKVDRRRLPDPAQGAVVGLESDAPASDLALRVAGMLAKLLGIEVPPTANVFEIGASSVDLIRAVNLLEREFGVRPPLRDVLRAPTPVGVAELLSRLGVGVEREEGDL